MAESCAAVKVDHATFGPYKGGFYNLARVRWASGRKNHEVQVNVSPTGRSVTVYVDGKRWKAAHDG
jgi:hypothetical protein